MIFRRQIAFTNGWLNTFKIALVTSMLMVFILVFLQPFDTYQSSMDFKILKLSGYGLTVFVPILGLHYLELRWYHRQQDKWSFGNEILFVSLLTILMAILAYCYHAITFSDGTLSLNFFQSFFLRFIIPFLPVFLTVLIFLRYTLGTVTIYDEQETDVPITITGENMEDILKLTLNRLIYAEAEENYVIIYFLDTDGKPHSSMMRMTFNALEDQLTQLHKVHRSYLVNPAFVKSVSGNSRKRIATLQGVEKPIPVSNKYYNALKKHLQFRP
jgi:hypothetical protein